MTFSRPGAVDLSALAARSAPPPAPGGAGAASYVVELDEQTFQTIALDASMRHIVVLSLWSGRSPQSADFNELLARVINEMGGQIQLGTIDVDANPRIAQALGANAVPLVVGLVKQQPVPLFQGTADETEVRSYLGQLVSLGAQHGVTGRAEPTSGAADDEFADEVIDPRFSLGDEAYARGDLEAAVAEYEKLAVQHPGDVEVLERLAGAKLVGRTRGLDLQQARAAAADAPDDLDAQMAVADLDVTGGHVEDAFIRLIDLVRRVSGDDRERLRERLLELFIVVGAGDPRVAQARRTLASALY